MQLHELLKAKMEARYPGQGGQERLRRDLALRGCEVTSQAISYWLQGERVPGRGKATALCDVLDIYGDQRTAVLEGRRDVEAAA